MAYNNKPEWATPGVATCVKQEAMREGNPEEWRDCGVLLEWEYDARLTEMNQLGLRVFRARVRWPSGRVDSLLPSMLESFPVELETKHPE